MAFKLFENIAKQNEGGFQRDVLMTINETLAEMETRLNAGEKPESLVDFFNEIFNSKMKGTDIVAR